MIRLSFDPVGDRTNEGHISTPLTRMFQYKSRRRQESSDRLLAGGVVYLSCWTRWMHGFPVRFSYTRIRWYGIWLAAGITRMTFMICVKIPTSESMKRRRESAPRAHT